MGEMQEGDVHLPGRGGFVFFDTSSDVQAVPDRYLETAYTLGAHTRGTRGLASPQSSAIVYAVRPRLVGHWLNGGCPLAAEAMPRRVLGPARLASWSVFGFPLVPIARTRCSARWSAWRCRIGQQPAADLRAGFRLHHAGGGIQREARPRRASSSPASAGTARTHLSRA